MIIGVTGTNGAGKGTVVDYLVSKGFKHYSVREELIAEIKRRGMVVDRSSMREVGNDLREKNGAGHFVLLFCDQAKKDGTQNVAIESVRSIGEAEAIKNAGGTIIATDADRKIRYDRVVLRGSETDKVDFDTWVMQEEREWNNAAAHDMNIPAVIKMADFTLQNNGTVEELQKQVDEVLVKIKP